MTRILRILCFMLFVSFANFALASNGTVTVINHLNQAIYVSCPNAARTPDIPANAPMTVYMGARLNSIYSALNMQDSGNCTYHLYSRQGPLIGTAHFQLFKANASGGMLPNYESATVALSAVSSAIHVTPESGSGRNLTFTIYPAG